MTLGFQLVFAIYIYNTIRNTAVDLHKQNKNFRMGFWSGIASLASAAVGKIKSVAKAAVGKIKSFAKACWSKTKSFAIACWKKIISVVSFLWSKIMCMDEIAGAVVLGGGAVAFGMVSLLSLIPGLGLIAKVISRLLFARRLVEVLFGFIFRGAFREDYAESYGRQRRERVESFALDLLMLCLSFLLFFAF